MLAFARRQHLKPQTVDLASFVHGMSDLLQRSLGPTVQIETRFPLSLPAVMADAHQLELALLNLAVNARDAMPEGGTITISAREGDQPSDLGGGRYVSLAVADTGHGMDEATLARAQEPFFTTKGIGKGTGLGLSMVHGLAEQSNGRLVLKSRVGKGTIVEIWLPVASVAAEEERSADVVLLSPQVARSLSVLVVDDDLLVLENTAVMLEDLGHHVMKARSGQEALDLLEGARMLDLVITDQAMPNMTGPQLLERIRAVRPQVSAIVATGFAEGGLDDWSVVRLSKPFDQGTLARMIHAVMYASDDRRVVSLRPRAD